MRYLYLSLMVAVVSVGLVSGAATQEPEEVYRDAFIVQVKTMDELILDTGEEAALIGVNYPRNYDHVRLFRYIYQTKVPNSEIMKLCDKSDAFIRNLAQGKTVKLEFDQEKKDIAGRLLVYAWVPVDESLIDKEGKLPDYYVTLLKEDQNGELKDFIFLNASVIKAGLAFPVYVAPNGLYRDLLSDSYQDALEKKRVVF